MRLFTGVMLIFLPASLALAQLRETYKPLPASSDKSIDLIRDSRTLLNREMQGIKSMLIRNIYSRRTQSLIYTIKSGAFIQDDTLQSFVDGVFKKLVANNSFTRAPGRVLVVRHPSVNAYCYGEGSFMVTVGLLSRIENESELAFTLAHELAHYELDHIKTKITQEVDQKLAKRTRQEISKLLNGEIDPETIEEFKRLIYDVSRYSRDMELQADSLGFVYFKNAGYYQPASLSLLTLLDSADSPKYKTGDRLFAPLTFSKFPFQPQWLSPRLSIYSRRPDKTLFFSNDSLKSHPMIDVRKAVLAPYIDRTPPDDNMTTTLKAVRDIADFESVESAYYSGQYDKCLHLALQLLNKHPANTYLVTMVSRIFVKLHEATMDHTFIYYVSQYTYHYHPELRLVNNFLYNLSPQELGEMAYHFLNNDKNFKEDQEEHYLLLWKISGITHRYDMQKRVKDAYRKKYPKPKFLSAMR